MGMIYKLLVILKVKHPVAIIPAVTVATPLNIATASIAQTSGNTLQQNSLNGCLTTVAAL